MQRRGIVKGSHCVDSTSAGRICMRLVRAVAHRALFPLVLSLLVASAAHAAVRMSVPMSIASEPGDLINVPVSLDNASGVLSYFFEISFDSAILECESVDKGTLTSTWGDPTVNPQSDRVSVAALGTTSLTGAGSLVVLHLRVKESATNGQSSALHFEGAELNDTAIPVETSDGEVLISAVVHMTVPEAIMTTPGAEINVDVTLDDASGVFAYFFDLYYDSDILEHLGTERGTLTWGWGDPTVNPQPGNVSVGGFGATELAGFGSLATIRFQVKPSATPGQTSPLRFETYELNDTAIAVSTTDGSVDVVESVPLGSSSLLTFLLLGTGVLILTRWSHVECASLLANMHVGQQAVQRNSGSKLPHSTLEERL